MKKYTTECPDWEKRIVAGESLIGFSPLFPEVAEQALEVFGNLRMVDAPGSPLMKDTMQDWAKEYVAAIFGAYDPNTGRRHIAKSLLCISKKNGKSTLAAGIMLTALILNWRLSAEAVILAPTKEIANTSFKPIRDMIAADPELTQLFQVSEHTKTITHRVTKATLKVIAADSVAVTGIKASFIFIDELHEFGKSEKANNILLEVTGALSSRKEGFVIYATTHSEEAPAGIFAKILTYARKVRDGKVKDNRFLPVLYEFPKSFLTEGEKDPNYLLDHAYITNPNWNVSVDEEFIKSEFKQAEDDGEDSLRLFMAKHLNKEVGLALMSKSWEAAEFWEAHGEKLSLDDLIVRSEVICIGIDGGGLADLLGVAVMGREKETGKWLLWNHAWAHSSVLERYKQSTSRFNDFERQGDLTIVNYMGEDVDELASICSMVEASGKLHQVGVDPQGIGSIIEAIVAEGVEERKIGGVSQGWKLTSAIKTAERKLASGGIKHAGQPLMTWCVQNARVEPRGNAILITRQASGAGKIDPLMASFNAISIMATNPQSKKYEMHFI